MAGFTIKNLKEIDDAAGERAPMNRKPGSTETSHIRR
jgi:hypothetical protein